MAETRAHAGVAAGRGGVGPDPLNRKYVRPTNPARGVTYTTDHPIGGDYEPVPPLPAEEQHAKGHQPQAALDEEAAGDGMD